MRGEPEFTPREIVNAILLGLGLAVCFWGWSIFLLGLPVGR